MNKPCIATKTVNRSQMTVLWYIDDLKISHKESTEVMAFIDWLNTKYTSLTVHQGKAHDYLGMDFDYSTQGVLHVSMVNYTRELIDNFPMLITSTATTPAADHLFKVRHRNEAELLPADQAIAFHHTSAQQCFLMLCYITI